VIRVWSAILIACGVLLAGFELKPRRVTHHRLRSGTDATQTRLTRRGLARTLGDAVTGVDGISGAAVSVRHRRARITATATAGGRDAAAALTDPVTEALRRRLDDMNLHRRPRLKIRVRPGSR
jgi:ribosomal protein S12 methylthiotransferase accessory factor YcaO